MIRCNTYREQAIGNVAVEVQSILARNQPLRDLALYKLNSTSSRLIPLTRGEEQPSDIAYDLIYLPRSAGVYHSGVRASQCTILPPATPDSELALSVDRYVYIPVAAIDTVNGTTEQLPSLAQELQAIQNPQLLSGTLQCRVSTDAFCLFTAWYEAWTRVVDRFGDTIPSDPWWGTVSLSGM